MSRISRFDGHLRQAERTVTRVLLTLAVSVPLTVTAQPVVGRRMSAPHRAVAPRSASSALPATRPLSSARAPLGWGSPFGREELASELADLLSAKVRSGSWGVMVVSLTRGDTLFTHDAGVRLLPASTFKLYTTALAFERLGPAYRFSTDVYREGAVEPDGTLDGDLVLRGGGDPSLTRRFFNGDANAPMRALARQVAAAGIHRVSGDVIGDGHAFESKSVPDGWLHRYLQASYAARVSALSLNENVVYVTVTPGTTGRAPGVSLQPATTTLSVSNAARTVAGTRTANLRIGLSTENSIAVRGAIGSRSEPKVYVLVVEDPARFTTGAFARALADAGVEVDGKVRLGQTSEDAVKVTSLESPPLTNIVDIMNRESVNHFAELIFRNVARQGDAAGVGSAAMGNALLRDFLLLQVGSAPSDVFAADGSGLSILDRTTARSLVQLLGYANRAPWSREFHESLPVAGREETLRLRMRSTPAQDNLHAKTGTTNDVVALSGYVSARDGEVLAFAFLYNGRDRWNARATIDAMGATLASFDRE